MRKKTARQRRGPAAKVGTEARIVDLVQELIQTRGFNAISYQDIADRIGIRKASIHYYFPSKADLGEAVIKRYRAALEAVMTDARGRSDFAATWQAYLRPFLDIAATPDKVCLCGALAGEFQTLSPAMQKQVAAFFIDHQVWLARLFDDGRRAGVFAFKGDAADQARVIFSALQGGLLMTRALHDSGHMTATVDRCSAMLGVRA
jgi:TetR/AcrR family transcriptional regulator, transcriptional repressor for nem operon